MYFCLGRVEILMTPLVYSHFVYVHDFFETKSQRENRFKEATMFWKKFQVKTLQYFFHFEPLFILEFSLCLHDFFRRNHSMKIDYSRHASLKMHQNTCYKKFSNKIQNNGNCKEKKIFLLLSSSFKTYQNKTQMAFSLIGCATKKWSSW